MFLFLSGSIISQLSLVCHSTYMNKVGTKGSLKFLYPSTEPDIYPRGVICFNFCMQKDEQWGLVVQWRVAWDSLHSNQPLSSITDAAEHCCCVEKSLTVQSTSSPSSCYRYKAEITSSIFNSHCPAGFWCFPAAELRLWIRCAAARKLLNTAGQRLSRTGVGDHWYKSLIIFNYSSAPFLIQKLLDFFCIL